MRIRSAEPSEVLHNSNLQEKVVPRDIRPLYTYVYRGLFCALAMSRARYSEAGIEVQPSGVARGHLSVKSIRRRNHEQRTCKNL